MSYYSIIEDNFTRPVPKLTNITFINWASLTVAIYLVLIFLIGVIYTFNKDNQDFRFLYL